MVQRLCSGCIALLFLLSLVTAQTPSTGSTSGSKSAADPLAKSTGKVADFRSKNYFLHTDLDKVEAEKLLIRLETMLRLISTYWGHPQNGIVELYVAKDITKWPREILEKMPGRGVSQIADGAGVTITESVTVGGKVAAIGGRLLDGAAKAIIGQFFAALARKASPAKPGLLARLFGRRT